jgi:hypothetical protein
MAEPERKCMRPDLGMNLDVGDDASGKKKLGTNCRPYLTRICPSFSTLNKLRGEPLSGPLKSGNVLENLIIMQHYPFNN